MDVFWSTLFEKAILFAYTRKEMSFLTVSNENII